MRRLSEKSLTNAALFYLRRYSATSAQLALVLRRKARRVKVDEPPPPAQVDAWIDAVLRRLTAAGYLDDARVGAAKAASLQRAGKSRKAVRQTLTRKGVPAPLTQTLAAQHDDEAAAWTCARKKRLGPWRPHTQRAERRQKDLAALVRAGFAYGLARKVVDAPEPPAP